MDISNIRGSGDSGMIDEEDVIRVEGGAKERFEALKRRAIESEEGAVVRKRVGERMVDLTEEYFPEEVAARRRKIAGAAFGAGVVVGAVGGAFLRE